MKDLGTKILANIHWVILIWGCYSVYVKYEEHIVLIEAVTSQVPEVDAQIKATERNVAEIQENMGKINEFKVRVEEVAKNIEAVQKQLPADINDSQIMGFLDYEMGLLNIKNPSQSPGIEIPSTYFLSKDYNLKGQGTFLQFMIFFERLGNADRIYNIRNLKFTSIADSKKGRFQLLDFSGIIQAFRFNPDFRVDRGFESPEVPVEGAVTQPEATE